MSRKHLGVFFAASFLLLSLTPTTISAAQFMSNQDTITIAADQTIDEDLYLSAEQLTVEGTVNGDVFVAGGQIIVNATINGNLYIAGGDLNLSGTVSQDLYIGGGEVNIQNLQVSQDAIIAAGNVLIDDRSNIQGKLILGSGNTDLQGNVNSLLAGAGNLLLSGNVNQDAIIGAGNINIASDAQINQDLIYASDHEATISDNADIGGGTHRITSPVDRQQVSDTTDDVLTGIAQGMTLISFVSSLVTGLLLLTFLPFQINQISLQMYQRPLLALGIGFLILLVSPVILIILGISIFGLPIMFSLLALVIALTGLTNIFVANTIGKTLADSTNLPLQNRYLQFFIGLTLYFLVTSIPILGFFVSVTGILIGFGSFALYLHQIIRRSRLATK